MIEKVRDFISLYRNLTQQQLVLSFNDLIDNVNVCQYLLELMSLLNSDKLEILKEILSIILMIDSSLQSISVSLSIPLLINELNALNNNKIDELLLRILIKIIEKSENNINDDIIFHILNYSLSKVSADDLSISELASNLIEIFMINYDVEKYLPIVFSHSHSHINNSTIYIRYITIMAKILTFSDKHFDASLKTGCVNAIFDICQNSNDILAQIVTIELILNFSYTSHGLRYLFTNEVMSWLVITACGSQNRSITSNELLGPTALRLIGEILISSSSKSLIIDLCWFHEESAELMNNFLNAISSYIESSEESNRLIGIRALTDLALSSKKGYHIVLNHDPLIQSLLSLLNGKVEVQAVVLCSIARILDQQITEPSSEEKQNSIINEHRDETDENVISEKKRHLLKSIGEVKRMNTITYLMKIAKQPVKEIRLAAYDVLRAIAGQSKGMGIHLLYSTSGFREFIEDRETEFSKEGKEAKFSVIETIAINKGFLSADVSSIIEKMINEGAYYRPLIMETLTANNE